jgi:hypothetical protein
MYDNGASGSLAATGTGLMVFGNHIGIGTVVSVGLGLILVGAALVFAFRRTHRTRRARRQQENS